MTMSGPDRDPTVWVTVADKPVNLMADSGAVYTCVRPEDATHLSFSGHYIRTVGFEGKGQLIPLTRPVDVRFKNQLARIPVLVSASTPVGLLGRDALCKMNCIIRCTPDGCIVQVPDEPLHQLPVFTQTADPIVCWLAELEKDFLYPALQWEEYIKVNLSGARAPTHPFHCTMQYSKEATMAQADEWLSRQPSQVRLSSSCIIVGPQGAAMKIDNQAYINDTFSVTDSIPHVTLFIADDSRQKHLGPMMAQADSAEFVQTPENPLIWRSVDELFLKIMISAHGTASPQTVTMSNDSLLPLALLESLKDPSAQPVTPLEEEMLTQVPHHLWSKHSTDIGLIKSAQPVRVRLIAGAKPPWKRQYDLKPEALKGINPEIKGLVQAGVLGITTCPISNMPILPVVKSDNSYRLVHDLRAINDVVVDFHAEVPDPHTLLLDVPPDATCYTVLDLAGAFHSVPLSVDSQKLFGFTYENEHYIYKRLPQGYTHSPHIFNKVLKDDLADIADHVTSTVLHYVDDIVICSIDVPTCHRDSMFLLQRLAEKGHRVSQKKLQYCRDTVVYLGHKLSPGHYGISDVHLLAIRQAPKPQTVRQVMKFLGITGYSSTWLENYTVLTGPLRALIKDTGSDLLQADVAWSDEALLAFETIKTKLMQAPALKLPDYSRVFMLYVATSEGGASHACAVLAQQTGISVKPQPIAYYSQAFSEVEMGLPECYRALVAVYLMYEKASAITMGYPVNILVHHSVRNLLFKGKYSLTMSRIRDYHRLLEQKDVTVVRCDTVNPAESLPLPHDGTPHDCVQEAEKYSRLRSDLQALPLSDPEVELWTDGSCYRVADSLSAGYAVVQAQGSEFVTAKAEVVPQPCSAQLAELIALTEACLMAEGKRVNIYTDSSYAMNVCHLFGAVWKSRGFKSADGSPIKHNAQILKLLSAMMKPREIAISKVAAHKTDSSRITKGNVAADAAAKAVAGANKPGKVLLVTHSVDFEKNISLDDLVMLQNEANEIDKDLWRDRGAVQDATGLWRNHEGLVIAPPDLLGMLIREAHGVAHVSKGEVRRRIVKKYGFWAPYLDDQIDQMIGRCTICLKNNVRRGIQVSPGYIPTPRGPFQELVIDYCDMLNPVGGKRYLLVVVDRFSRWVEATPTSRKDARSVVKFLCKEVFPRFGLPLRLSSDNGKEFVDKTVKLILQKLKIKQRLGAVYHPQSQGICESMNGVLKTRIVKISEHTGLNWVEALPLALMACRSSEIRHLHMTPHELAMGRRMITPGLHASGKGPSLSLLDTEMKAYVQYMSNMQKSISAYVSKKQEQEEKEEQKKSWANTILPGDQVYVKVYRRKWKDPRRDGPFEVTRTTGHAIQVKGSPLWYHLSHCVKAPADLDDSPPEEPVPEGDEDHAESGSEESAGDAGDLLPTAGSACDGAADHSQSRGSNDDDDQQAHESRLPAGRGRNTPKRLYKSSLPAGSSSSNPQAKRRGPRKGSGKGPRKGSTKPSEPQPPIQTRPIRERRKPSRYEDYSET